MIQYIKELAATIQLAKQNQLGQGVQKIHGLDVPDIHSLFKGFAEELDRLDPRDFDPAVRHDFVVLRVAIRNWAKGQIGNGTKATAEQQELGVILVEGPNDVMALNGLGVPAVAVCSNTVTDEQADKLAALAREFGGNTVSVMFDLDREGINGSQQTILETAKRCRTRFAWTAELAGGLFKGRQPESVTLEEWETAIRPALMDAL